MNVSSPVFRCLRRTPAADIRIRSQSIQEVSHDGKSMGSEEGISPSYGRLGALGVFFGDELGKFIGDELPANEGSASACCEGY